MIKVEEPQKAAVLMQILKSMDFVQSVDNLDNYTKVKLAFEKLFNFSATTQLKELTMDDIIAEIKEYRNEKKLRSH